MKNTLTRTIWDSALFYSDNCPRDKHGKKDPTTRIKQLIGLPNPTPNQHEITYHLFVDTSAFYRESYTPNAQTFNTVRSRNNDLRFRDSINALFGEIQLRQFDEYLKFENAEFSLKTHGIEKSRIIARNRMDTIINGKPKTRTIKQTESTPPDYENYRIPRGYVFRFYFYDIAKNKTITRTIRTNRARKHPTRTIHTPTLNGKLKTEKMLLPLIKIIQLEPKKTIIYNTEIKPEYEIKTPINPIKPIKTNAEHNIIIDYKQLARAEPRISKKWFALLVESLKDETRIQELPPHLKRLRRKIVKSISTTETTIRKRAPIISRRNTVIEYNHKLELDARADIHNQRARKLKLAVKQQTRKHKSK